MCQLVLVYGWEAVSYEELMAFFSSPYIHDTSWVHSTSRSFSLHTFLRYSSKQIREYIINCES